MIYGCTDSNAVNYNAMAHIDDGTCFIISNNSLSNKEENWQIYPNPFRDKIQIILNGADFQKLIVSSINGVKLFELIANGQKVIEIGEELSAGTYIIQLQNNKGISSKLLIKI
jgi:hypothetical protein